MWTTNFVIVLKLLWWKKLAVNHHGEDLISITCQSVPITLKWPNTVTYIWIMQPCLNGNWYQEPIVCTHVHTWNIRWPELFRSNNLGSIQLYVLGSRRASWNYDKKRNNSLFHVHKFHSFCTERGNWIPICRSCSGLWWNSWALHRFQLHYGLGFNCFYEQEHIEKMLKYI